MLCKSSFKDYAKNWPNSKDHDEPGTAKIAMEEKLRVSDYLQEVTGGKINYDKAHKADDLTWRYPCPCRAPKSHQIAVCS